MPLESGYRGTVEVSDPEHRVGIPQSDALGKSPPSVLYSCKRPKLAVILPDLDSRANPLIGRSLSNIGFQHKKARRDNEGLAWD